MGNKYTITIFISCIFFCCSRVKQQKIIIDNEKKIISAVDSTFVIDSICIKKFNEVQFSTSLNNKSKGASQFDMNYTNIGYKTYVNKLEMIPCNDENLSILIIVRKKEHPIKASKEIIQNFKKNEFIQVSYSKYFSCSKRVDTLETVAGMK